MQRPSAPECLPATFATCGLLANDSDPEAGALKAVKTLQATILNNG